MTAAQAAALGKTFLSEQGHSYCQLRSVEQRDGNWEVEYDVGLTITRRRVVVISRTGEIIKVVTPSGDI